MSGECHGTSVSFMSFSVLRNQGSRKFHGKESDNLSVPYLHHFHAKKNEMHRFFPYLSFS